MPQSSVIYHWTTAAKALTALRDGRLKARHWEHYLETEGRFATGSSWSLDPIRWQRENPVCLAVLKARVPNTIHAVPGNRTYWLTRGKTQPWLYDPKAYLDEPTEPDEEFVEGPIEDLRSCLLMVYVDRSAPADDFLMQLAQYPACLVRDPPTEQGFWLEVREASRTLEIAPRILERRMNQGRLPWRHIDGGLRVSLAGVAGALEEEAGLRTVPVPEVAPPAP